MNNKISIFKNKKIDSFNNTDLSTNIKAVDSIIKELRTDFKIHNHSNTQFVWQNFILSHKGGLRNLRQITAEISKKRLALIETKHKHNKQIIELDKLKDSLKGDLDKYERSLIELEISSAEEKLSLSVTPIEGAMKDILTLKSSYDQLKKEYGDYTEKDLEDAEVSYWIKRIFSQALRDIRSTGRIGTGNQEVLEQMGFNISYVFNIMSEYLNTELKSSDSTGKFLDYFLNESVKNFNNQVLEYVGLSEVIKTFVEKSSW